MTSEISSRSRIGSIGCTGTGASYNADRRFGGPHRWNGYLVLPGVLGLGVLVLGVLLLEPLELGEVVLLLPELVPPELGVVVLLLPPVAPPLLDEPDFSKYASHSERETMPSLFVSTVEKLGAELLAPLEAVPPTDELPLALGVLLLPLDELSLDVPDEPEEPVALGDELPELEPEAPVEDDPELCAIDTLAIAKSAAAVAVPTNFNIWRPPSQGIKG